MYQENDNAKPSLTRRNILDSNFKQLMHNTDVLSKLVGDWVTELKDKDPEYIRKCLSPASDNIPGRNAELINSRGRKSELDSLFDITLPDNEKVKLILNVEGQADPNPGYSLVDRALFYASSIIADQRGKDFSGDHYEDLKKVYSVWCVLQPRDKDRNSIIRYRVQGSMEWSSDERTDIPISDRLEILVVNIGWADSKAPNTMMGIMNTMFSSELSENERNDALSINYNIQINNILSRNLEAIRMTLTLDEELENYRNREAYNRAMEKAIPVAEKIAMEKAMEKAMEEASETIIEEISKVTLNVMDSLDITIDEALGIMDLEEPMRSKVYEKVNEKNSER